MPRISWGFIVLPLLLPNTALSRSGGAPAGHTGAPGELTCTACHGGTPNSGTGRLQIQLPAGASTYVPGQSIRVMVTLQDGSAQRWGFQLTARSASSPASPAGAFSLVPDDTNAQIVQGGGVQYVTHTSAGTRPGTSGSATWQVDWTPPAEGGPVTFYAAGNAANNSGSPVGDLIYATSLSIEPAGSTSSGEMRVLPQLAFGGGWYTAVYLYNGGESAVSFPARFFGLNGQPLTVAGTDSRTVTLEPKASAILEANNVGELSQGWIAFELPADVRGHGVFRQSIQGRANQEAVVPFSGASSRSSVLLFDDTAGLRTAVAVANPGSSETTVTVVARDERGQQIGSTATVTLGPRQRVALVLADRPELANLTGRRGSVEFTASTGAVSVLGLRFGAEAFTSIPAIER